MLASLLSATVAPAGDWPQWRGPNRDGTSAETSLLEKWPANGPPVLWSIDTLGPGYSGPAVVGDRLYVMTADADSEYVAALTVAAGREVWRVKLGPLFKNAWGDGPRGTPTVVGETVVALGAQGVLVAADRASGREIWRTDLRKDHAGQLMRGNVLGFDWGYSESPLVEAGRVVVSPGGPKGTVAAFDLITGKLVWRTTKLTDAASYSSAVAADIHGVRQLVQLTGGVEYSIGAAMKVKPRAVGLSPADGAVLWECPIHYTTAGVINTPVVRGNTVYATCGYSAGCTIVRVEKSAAGFKVTDATSKDARRAMPVYHGGVVPVGDSVIGYSETAGWVCQRLPKGETVWEVKRGVTGGAAVLVGGMLVIVTVEGGVALTEPGEDGWTLRGEFVLPRVSPIRKANGKIRVCTHPVVADGRLYARDQGTLYCFDLRKTTSAR